MPTEPEAVELAEPPPALVDVAVEMITARDWVSFAELGQWARADHGMTSSHKVSAAAS